MSPVPILDGAVLLYGVDSSGVVRPLLVDSDGSLAGGGAASDHGALTGLADDDHSQYLLKSLIDPNMSQLGADVAMATANTFYDGPSRSLVAGTWLVMASVHVVNGATGAGQITGKIWDGTTVWASGLQFAANTNFPLQLTIVAIVTLVATTTVKISVTCNLNNATLKAAATTNPAGNNASTLVALRVA